MQTYLNHPLAINTKIKAVVTGCACRGGKLEVIEGVILKVIPNNGSFWYYTSEGRTVQDIQVQCTI
jgi:hypothetical protein